ncbi:MAG: glycosyltransferase family 9 protein [Myxococcota bacterium]
MNRILVIRLGALGDVLRTLPAVWALRELHPAAQISWLVEPRSAGAVALCPAVDEVLLFPRDDLSGLLRTGRLGGLARLLKDLLLQLRRPGFDWVLDFHGLLKSGVLSWLTGAPLRVGYAPPQAREFSWLFNTRRVELPRPYCSRFERNQALVADLGAGEPPAGSPLGVPASAEQRMRRALAEESGALLLHPGTSEPAAHKRWPAERFAELAQRAAATLGRPCLVLAGPGAADAELQGRVVEASQGGACRAPETKSLADLAALLDSGSAFVGADSGPLHMASLLGTPVVQLLGPTDPIHNAPYAGTAWRRAHVPVACSPCRHGCAAVQCMKALSVDLVWNELQALWQQVSPMDTIRPVQGGVA